MKESKLVRTFLMSAALIALAIPAIASASPDINDNGRTAVRVSSADLDLSKVAGAQTLYIRLRAASHSVCGSRSLTEAGSLNQLTVNKRCFESALSKAVARIGNAKLNAIHAG